MSACANQLLARTAPIALGLRVGVIGSENFRDWVCGVLRRDHDVSTVKTWPTLILGTDDPSLNMLVIEAVSVPTMLSPALAETLTGISLIAVAGPDCGSFADLENAAPITLESAEWWAKAKEQAVQRRLQEFAGLVNALATEYQASVTPDHTLRLEDGGEVNTVQISTVDWIRAAGNYVEVRVNGRSHLLRSEMHAVQSKLPRTFLRIHRKVIINMTRLAGIEADSSTRLFASMTSGERFPISRGRRNFVRSRWEELRHHQQ
jgi:DNA-binding LytR/AlgR family response regulator